MMLTILGLPPKFKFPDVKLLIKEECNISEFILDNLETDDDGSKKVRVGVADGDEGYILIKCLDRFRLPGNFVLTVVPVGKQNMFDQKPSFHNKPRSDYQSNQERGDFHSNKPKFEYHGNQSRDYQGNTPGGDYGGKPRMEKSGNHRIEYSANQVRSEYQGNKPRTETGADFLSNKQRDGIGQTQGNTSRDYPGNKLRAEFQGSQVRSDYHGNQPREFQGVHRNDYQGALKDDFPGNKVRSEFQSSSSRDYQGNQSREFQNNRYGNQGPPAAGDHPSPWSTNAGAGSNQWGTAMNTQVPQNSFGYQQSGHQIQPFAKQPVPVNRSEARPPQARGPQQEPQPGFGFSPKSGGTLRVGRNDNRAHALRSVEISEAPINAAAQQGRYPPNAPYPRTDKPVTIMKDNFQGPTQYNIGSNQHGQYQGQAPIQPWGSSTPKPFSKSNPVQYDKPYVDDRKFPTDRARIKAPNEPISVTEAYPDKSRFSPQKESHGRRHSLDRRFSPAKYPRRMSPSGRDMPAGRRISPSSRDMPAGRRMSPSGRDMQAARRMSPSSREMPAGRRLSPSARDMPAGRQMSPSGRNMPTGRRMSPLGRDILTRRLISPSGRDVQSRRRISPSSRDVITERQVPTGGHGSPSARNIMGRSLMSPSRRLVSPIGERGSPGRIVVKTGRDMTIAGRRISPVGMRITPGDRSREMGRSGARQLQSPPRDSPPRQHPRYSPGRHSVKQADNFGDGSKSKQVRPAYEPPQQAAQNMYSGYRGGHEAGQYPRERNSWHRDRENREEPRRSHPSPHKSRSPNRYKRQSPSPLSPRRSWALEKRASPDAPPPPMWPVADRAPEWIRPKQDDRPRPRPNRDPHYQDVDRDYRLDTPRNQKQDRQDLRDYRDERRRESPRDEPKLPLRDEINRDFVNIYKKTMEFKKRAQEHRSKSGERRREGGEERRERRESPRLDRPTVDWRLEEPEPKRPVVNPARTTRERAVDELATKILAKNTYCDSFTIEQKLRVKEELKLAISRRVAEMFGNHDVTFIEIIIKYQGRYDERDEQRMMREVLSSLPSQYRPLKRSAPESSEIPAKSSRWSADTDKPEGAIKLSSEPLNWTLNIEPPKLMSFPLMPMPQMPQIQQLPPMPQPVMVPAPYMAMQPDIMYPPPQMQPIEDVSDNLYLCKDDFDTFTDNQANYLKDFLVSQIVKTTETSQGWAPDLTLKGLQSQLRYEVSTRDEASREWLQNLDFSELGRTHIFSRILVYTKEELWYERAAVWLPGHSRCRNIEPLEKLRLQNKCLDDVDVGKWKLVRKIILAKGIRLYVDMPPSCARALEQHKMLLSYELQKVNVYLKAVAVDKDAFDAGLKEFSINDPMELIQAVQNSPVPSLPYDPSVVKITLKGSKTMSIIQARKIKEMIVYHVFKYHQQGGHSKTDFLKYGYVTPNYFGVVPENNETKRWIYSQHLGKLNRHPVVIISGDDERTHYFRMVSTQIPNSPDLNPAIVLERLKHSNQGVKGINFNLWNPIKLAHGIDYNKRKLEIDVDLESVQTLIKMKYQLDYDMKHGHASKPVYLKSAKYSTSELENRIAKFKTEMIDTYDVTNMELESSDEDLICLD